MCIVLLSTAHPAYPFILLSNRDEFIFRPTASADWWDSPNEHVLGGRDLERQEHGTWLGITKQGRIAALTNFREEGADKVKDKSRGGIINAYLTSPPAQRETSHAFTRRLIHDVGVNDVGGFSMLFGELKAPSAKDQSFPGLSILSNRSASAENLTQLATRIGETHGLSNSHFGDNTWPKVVQGEALLQRAIQEDIESCERGEGDREGFIGKLFSILSSNSLRKREPNEVWDTYVLQMRNSIFIPPVRGPIADINGSTTPVHEENEDHVGPKDYGTQRQIVILVEQTGQVTFVERTLYGEDGKLLSAQKSEKAFNFTIEDWWA